MEGIFAHMEDANLNDPIEPPSSSGVGGGSASVEMLIAMEFQKQHAEKAPMKCGSSLEKTTDWLLTRMDSLDAMNIANILKGCCVMVTTTFTSAQSKEEVPKDTIGTVQKIMRATHWLSLRELDSSGSP